jgi:hypothetical protein
VWLALANGSVANLLKAIAAEALISSLTIVLAAMAAVIEALAVPSKEPEVPLTSPVREMVLPVASAVAEDAKVAVAALPVTLPVIGPTKAAEVTVPLALMLTAATVPVRVGEPANTLAPVPVSSVNAEARLALEGVARKVATPLPKPLIPDVTGNPVAFVRVPEAGVPRTGAVRVGEVRVLLVRVWVSVVPTTTLLVDTP